MRNGGSLLWEWAVSAPVKSDEGRRDAMVAARIPASTKQKIEQAAAARGWTVTDTLIELIRRGFAYAPDLPDPFENEETEMTIGAFHANNGLFFKRNEDGSVWVEKRVPTVSFGAEGETRTGPMAVVEHWHLTADDWASAVASVCKRGEVGETFGEALHLHNAAWGE